VNSIQIALESKLKLRVKLINGRLNGHSLLLRWELIFLLMNSSEGRHAAEHHTEVISIKEIKAKALFH
jgi:hypothetical protein